MNAYEAIYQKQLNELQRKIMLHQYGAIMDDPPEYQDIFQKQAEKETQVIARAVLKECGK